MIGEVDGGRRRRGWWRQGDDAVLEGSRHVERHHADDDRGDVGDRAPGGPDPCRGVWSTDGPVAVSGDEDHQPDAGHVSDGSQQPDVAHVRPRRPRVGAPTAVLADVPACTVHNSHYNDAKVDSAFHPPWDGKMSTGDCQGVKSGESPVLGGW